LLVLNEYQCVINTPNNKYRIATKSLSHKGKNN